jgi:hypothetical protein
LSKTAPEADAPGIWNNRKFDAHEIKSCASANSATPAGGLELKHSEFSVMNAKCKSGVEVEWPALYLERVQKDRLESKGTAVPEVVKPKRLKR